MSYDEMKISKLGDACCGCGACAAKCPKSCISMREDKFGFLHPVIDAGACVGCHACESVCPALGGGKCDEALGIRWAKGKSSELLEASSSGGIFGLLAESVIADGGVVCGAAWADGCRRVEHVLVEDAASLDCVMRSKYVQSRIGRGGSTLGFAMQSARVAVSSSPARHVRSRASSAIWERWGRAACS